MFEYLERHVAEIRRKPESVRIVYVWSMVGIVMIFVVFIWIFTLRENLGASVSGDQVKSIENSVQQVPVPTVPDKPSLSETLPSEGNQIGNGR